MSRPQKYFIWGMGLLGTSLALRLKKAGHFVAGTVRSERHLPTLAKAGLANIFLTEEQLLWSHLRSADGVIIATPPDAVPGILRMLEERQLQPSAWVTDVSSTKASIMAAAEAMNLSYTFIGSHPMAGSHHSGPDNADVNLYDNATVFVTPPSHTYMSPERISTFWRAIGCRVIETDAASHDRIMAYLSHGLHLISCLSVHMLADIPEVMQFASSPAGGSFRDLTRITTSDPQLWTTILNDNRQEVIRYLENFEKQLQLWRKALIANALPVADIFRTAADLRARVLNPEEYAHSGNS